MLELFKALLLAVARAFGFFSDKQKIDAGSAEARAANAEEAVHDITVANQARDAARDAGRDVHSTDELPDDGFRRD